MSTKSSETTNKRLQEIYEKVDDEAKDIPVHEMGETADGTITDIQIGIVEDFVPEEALEKWKGNTKTNCMEIIVKTPDETEIKKIMTFSPHPQSNLQKWKRRYGKNPEINDTVKLRHDGNFWQIN